MMSMKEKMLLLLVCGVIVQTASAQPRSAYRSNASSLADAHQTLSRFWLGDSADDVQNKCGLPAVTYALSHRQELDAQQRAALSNVLSRPVTQKNIRTGNFRIHYDTSGLHAPAMLDSQYLRIPGTADEFADSVVAILTFVMQMEHDSMGYLPPPPDNGQGGGPEYDIYIQELGGSSYGSTTPETPINNKPEGGTFTSFMVIDNDFDFVYPQRNRGMPALRVTIAHELHHAIQIGNYGYWQNDIHFYEMTSVWLEDALYTDVNDYYQYLLGSAVNPGHFRRPDIAFTSNAFIMYSRGVWCIFLAKRYGRDVIRRTWEEIRQVRPLVAMDAALAQEPYATNLRSAFVEWGIWNYFTKTRSDSLLYYPEGSAYPEVTRSARDFTPPQRTIDDQVSPFGSRYYDITSTRGQTLALVLTNLNTGAALDQNSSPFSFSLLLNESRPDESYMPTGANIFVKVGVNDPSNWFVKDLLGVAAVEDVFPNPFLVDGKGFINFPVPALAPVPGTLSIFTASLDLVYSARQTSVYMPQLGRQMFRWNGKTLDNRPANSGVYLYVLETPTQTLKGKFVVIRR